MSKKLKAIESTIQPNHKEAEIWVTPTNEDGSKEVKYWNRKKHEWDGCDGNNPILYYKISDNTDRDTDDFDALMDATTHFKAFDAVQNRFEFLPYSYKYRNETPNGLWQDTIAFAFLPIDIDYNDSDDYDIKVNTCEEYIQHLGLNVEVERISAKEYWDTTMSQLEHTTIIPEGSVPSDYIEINYVSGMTWREWLKSAYNRAGDQHNAYIPDNGRVRFSENSVLVVYETKESVYLDDTIMPIKYLISYPPV